MRCDPTSRIERTGGDSWCLTAPGALVQVMDRSQTNAGLEGKWEIFSEYKHLNKGQPCFPKCSNLKRKTSQVMPVLEAESHEEPAKPGRGQPLPHGPWYPAQPKTSLLLEPPDLSCV
ncbi:hypothetical protein AV530_000549 [Patagioenas fasciata monilis]|uniref:Uncharacterized protein n=1 Tax=Patagioenas fasciata monilis TaxID=372326 RepID=A0A1V4IFV2_PATFA|nr:hypothetical protein AV530_000549 [Patagioenas fasciata monilis]